MGFAGPCGLCLDRCGLGGRNPVLVVPVEWSDSFDPVVPREGIRLNTSAVPSGRAARKTYHQHPARAKDIREVNDTPPNVRLPPALAVLRRLPSRGALLAKPGPMLPNSSYIPVVPLPVPEVLPNEPFEREACECTPNRDDTTSPLPNVSVSRAPYEAPSTVTRRTVGRPAWPRRVAPAPAAERAPDWPDLTRSGVLLSTPRVSRRSGFLISNVTRNEMERRTSSCPPSAANSTGVTPCLSIASAFAPQLSSKPTICV